MDLAGKPSSVDSIEMATNHQESTACVTGWGANTANNSSAISVYGVIYIDYMDADAYIDVEHRLFTLASITKWYGYVYVGMFSDQRQHDRARSLLRNVLGPSYNIELDQRRRSTG